MAWLLFNNAAVSIVEHPKDPTCLVVRARVQGDVERFLGKLAQGVKINRTPNKDYLYRAFVSREMVAEAAAHRLLNINYPNFKNSVKESDRHSVYSSIWSVWLRLQKGIGLYGSWTNAQAREAVQTRGAARTRTVVPKEEDEDGYQRDLPWWREPK